MSTPSAKLKAQLLKEKESRQREEDTMAAAKSREPITPSIESDEETKPQSLEEDPFYISLLKPKKKEEEEEEVELVLAICRLPEGECVRVDMDLATAQAHCDAANKLYRSDDPNDRAKAELSWNLLKEGKEHESLTLLGLDPNGRKLEKSGIELRSPPSSIPKNASEIPDLGDDAQKTGTFSSSDSTATKENKEEESVSYKR